MLNRYTEIFHCSSGLVHLSFLPLTDWSSWDHLLCASPWESSQNLSCLPFKKREFLLSKSPPHGDSPNREGEKLELISHLEAYKVPSPSSYVAFIIVAMALLPISIAGNWESGFSSSPGQTKHNPTFTKHSRRFLHSYLEEVCSYHSCYQT